MQPDQNAVVVAYYQSAVTIEYLVQTYGFSKIVDGLKMFGKGKETPEVLRTITGKPIPQLDAEFRKYLEVRLAPYAGTFKLPTRGFDDVTKLEIAEAAAPRDAKAKANVALGYYYGGDADKAFTAADRRARPRTRAADRALKSSPRSRSTSRTRRARSSSSRRSSPTASTTPTSARASRRSPRPRTTSSSKRSSCVPRRSSTPNAATRTRSSASCTRSVAIWRSHSSSSSTTRSSSRWKSRR